MTSTTFTDLITDESQLRDIFGWPSERSLNKQIDRLDRYTSRGREHFLGLFIKSEGIVWQGPTAVHFSAIRIPYYSCLICLLPFALIWYILLRRFLAKCGLESTNRCPDCGYDLRASPERCPECGRVRIYNASLSSSSLRV